MMRKSLALALLALSLLTVWWRGESRSSVGEPIVELTAFPPYVGKTDNALRVEGVWKLTSEQEAFGGFSALALHGTDRLLLFSDYGTVLDIPLPSGGDLQVRSPLGRIGADTARKSGRDIEAATSFGQQTWLALENRNALLRLGSRLQIERSVTPRALADWPANGGPESLARLADGQFLVLREGKIVAGETDPIDGVLFAGDPTENARTRKVSIVGADGYHPVDAAAAPDGRIIILLRRLGFGWPLEFRSRLALLDPAELDGGSARLSQPIELSPLLPRDNYEGIAVRSAGERWEIWLVSDDNDSHFQASWLARLTVDPAALPD